MNITTPPLLMNRILLGVLLLFPSLAIDRAKDREEIRGEIDRIFQAFIHQDTAELRATHDANWLGYLEGSRTMIRGVDAYMDHSGHFWPGYGMTGYKIREFDMIFQGDAAFVAFIADIDYRTPGGPTHRSLRITDFFAHRDGRWIQAGSDTDEDPAAREAWLENSRTLSAPARKELLDAREKVWRAFFANDRAALEKLVPADTLIMDAGAPKGVTTRETAFEGAAEMQRSGTKLVLIDFPTTEMQCYGNTAILYSTYHYELEHDGQHSNFSGRVTEVFVIRDGQWVNPGWHMEPFRRESSR